jgi:threonine/homoserine/homoserine lactone efflux protein
MPDGQNFFVGLFDFSFEQSLLRRLVKLLYVLALLGGGVTVVALVVTAYQQSPAQAVLVLVAGIAGLFVWILCVRLGLEFILQVLRIADNIERATHSGGGM